MTLARSGRCHARGTRISFGAAAAAAVLATLIAPPAAAQRGGDEGPPPTGAFEFEYLGPSDGGRIAAVAGVPGSTDTYYAGAASGGVWKTTDGGRTFAPVFDEQPVQAIGALAVAPSDSSIVWAGTGEAWAIRDADVRGDGVYRSTDGGRSWRNMGLEKTGRIGRIVVHPTDPNTVYVCALGVITGPHEEKGVYRTRDGGETWDRVLFVNRTTGCSGLSMDPRDPDKLVAGSWEMVMHTWAMESGGEGSGVFVTEDGGDHWSRVTDGLPESPVGKIDVQIAPSDPSRVYALIEAPGQGSVWRSDDGGGSWEVVSWDRTLIGRAGYYIRLGVSSEDADELLVASSSMHRSTDGGRTFSVARGGCGDCHDIWIDPTDADSYVVTGDGGMGITTDHGENFTSVTLPIGQMYHVALDDRVPYWVYTNRQDNGTVRGPSDDPDLAPNVVRLGEERRGGFGRGGRSDEWEHGLGGCESGFTLPDPENPDVVWATCYGAKITRYDASTGVARSVNPDIHTLDSPPDAVRYRCHWTMPLAIDPFDHESVYAGCQLILRTTDRGQSWEEISPDLSTQDPSRIVSSGGVVPDNLGQFYGEVVFAIAPSPVQEGLIWAGTNDGQLWYTADGGGEWTNVTRGLEGLPEWGTIRKIQPSRFDAATAYVAIDRHLMDDPAPYVYRTTDMGRSWTRIDADLPSGGPLDYVMAVTENPNRRGMLFVGTGHAFYYSVDDGAHWTPFQDGLPASPVSWIEVAARDHDVVVSTYGRGIYVLRDITPLEDSAGPGPATSTHFYRPTPALREARSGSAEFVFRLEDTPSEPVRVEVLDAARTVVDTFSVTAHRGLNRVSWDLMYRGPKQVEMRTVAPDNPYVWDEPRFEDGETRPVTHWGIQGAQRAGPIAAPGRYAVRMRLGDRSYEQPFTVEKSPAIPSSTDDLAASTRMQTRIRDDIDTVAAIANRIEIMRKQIEDLRASHPDRAAALEALDAKMLEVEEILLSREDRQSDDKFFVEPYGTYLNLVWLNGEVGLGAGDVAGGADHRPTDAQVRVLESLEAEIAEAQAGYERLLAEEVPAFNEAMAGELPPITPESTASAPRPNR